VIAHIDLAFISVVVYKEVLYITVPDAYMPSCICIVVGGEDANRAIFPAIPN
jgi:hypothetical protein